jgi:subtilisin family serine protease
MSLYLLLLMRWLQHTYPARFGWRSGSVRGLWLALLGAPLLLVGWVLWGAVGSPADVLLNGLTAGLFGVCGSLTLQGGLLLATQDADRPYRFGDVLADSLGALITLLIMATGLGQIGIQPVLSITLPLLAPAVVVASLWGRGQDRAARWVAPAFLLAIAALGPLTFVDPDEMMLVISSSPGDLIGWVSRAAGLGVLMVLTLDVLALAWIQRLMQGGAISSGVRGLTGVMWGAVVLAYVFGGQPGFYGEQLFVVLKDQADLTQQKAILDPGRRRAEVYRVLTAHADETQASLRQKLNRMGVDYQAYYLVNAMEVNGGLLMRWWLESQPEVDRVLDSPHLRPLPAPLLTSVGMARAPRETEWNLTLIGADRVWNELGVSGAGIVIGQSDSGVQGDHPEIADSYLGRDGQDDYRWYDPWYGSPKPVDFGGHGTHTMGSVVGNTVGVAPDADWIGCVNLARNLGNPAVYLSCWQFLLAPFPQQGDALRDGKPELGANVLNNSWGCPWVEGCDLQVYEPAVQALRTAGVFVVVSAGNSGYGGCGTVQDPPAVYSEVFSVGAVSRTGELVGFSSLGPSAWDGGAKPDILAPGADVLSSYPDNSYEVASGTSMAGPHVTGVVALMWSANPKLIGDVDLTEKILIETARPYNGVIPQCVQEGGDLRNASGAGVIDAYAAVQRALSLK